METTFAGWVVSFCATEANDELIQAARYKSLGLEYIQFTWTDKLVDRLRFSMPMREMWCVETAFTLRRKASGE